MSAAPATSLEAPLAIICGGGSLPLAVAELASARGRPVVLFPLRGAAEGTAVERFPHHWIYIGQLGKFFRLARAEGCREVVFIGSLVRPSIWRVHPDLRGLTFMFQVLAAFRGGDNHLLSGMSRLFEQQGFLVRGAHEEHSTGTFSGLSYYSCRARPASHWAPTPRWRASGPSW